MSTFCNDCSVQGIGFIKSPIKQTEINDSVNATGDALNKMGTSIPTPFARMFYFMSAFREVNAQEDNNPGTAHAPANPTSYHALISDWLDMMEFVFVYGDSQNNPMEIIPWDDNAMNALKNSNLQEHKRLYKALDDAIQSIPGLKAKNAIYIFRYKYEVIGGSSPISIVYTSPNCRQHIGGKFPRRGSNGMLFDNTIIPLHKRDKDFRLYIYRLAKFYGSVLNRFLYQYINDSLNNYDGEMKAYFNLTPNDAQEYKKAYITLKDIKGINVSVGEIELKGFKFVQDNINSDYMIEATADRYKTIVVNGASVKVPTPLVLSKTGVSGANYWNGVLWNPKLPIPPALSPNLTQRQLPGFPGTFYPYLTIDDFLETKIIRVSYNLQKSKFYTGSNGDISFLLPLKRTFFKYFNLSDLKQKDKSTGEYMFSMKDNSVNTSIPSITVTLNIPIKYGQPIQFVKTYGKEDTVDCRLSNDTFDMAVFPFYKLSGNNARNAYNIMLGYSNDNKKLSFYSLDELDNAIAVDVQKRTSTPIHTEHYHLDQEFDLVEIDVAGSKALIIPELKKIDMASLNNDFVFCVDFGTTHTHVAYGQKGNLNTDTIKSLDVTEDDAQVVYLNDHQKDKPDAGFGHFTSFLAPACRELVPILIGAKGTAQKYQFPIRTATYERKGFKGATTQLFSNINIGFNYLDETHGPIDDNEYKTDIKWPKDADVKAKDRVDIFFEEIMWIMKNKAVLNGGRPDFTLVYTYPQSMRIYQVDQFKTQWLNARRKAGAYTVQTNDAIEKLNKPALEGVAPYYSFLSQFAYTDTYANIDIGGGTTDIVYIDPKNGGMKLSFSAYFAADDLWGDGISPFVEKKKNGFLRLYKQSPQHEVLKIQHDDDLHSLQVFSDNTAQSSSDVISFLFSKDGLYRFSDCIKASLNAKQLVLLHFSSIIYYLVKSLLTYRVGIHNENGKPALKLPKHISFTGMGSKYINILGGETSIASVVSAIFRYRLAKENIGVGSLDVRFAEEPKRVTAEGGVIMTKGNAISPMRRTVYGYDGEKPTAKQIPIDEIDTYKSSVMKEFNMFMDMFEDNNFRQVVSENLNIIVNGKLKSEIKDFSDSSFDMMSKEHDDLNKAQKAISVEEPMFFWPLKDSIYQLGIKMNQQPAK